jgi:acetyltransferase-like isoleucine patch superfamily enzyme
MESNFIVHPGVTLGENVELGAYVVIGLPARSHRAGAVVTVVGDGAVIRSHTVIYAGNRIGRDFNTGHHVMIREDNLIGDNVSIGTGTVIEHHVQIADGVRIHSQAFIPETSILRRNCWIGPRVCVTNAKYPRSRNVKNELIGADIGEEAKIGANATLLPGVRIGAAAIVGAGAVVVRDVEPGAVVAGNPARVINRVEALPYD